MERMKRRIIIAMLLMAVAVTIGAQVVTTEPAIPVTGTEIIIWFHSDRETGELKDYTGPLYAHTGVTIAGVGKWQNVIESWGNNDTQPQFEYMGNNLYRLVVTPDIHTYYPDLTGTEEITEICLVIRSADAELQTSDIFISIFEPGLNITFVTPEESSLVVPLDEIIDINISATLADSIVLFVDNVRELGAENQQEITFQYQAGEYGGHWIKAVAWDYPEFAADSFFLFVKKDPVIASLPAGVTDGINITGAGTVTLVLYAPGKSDAFVLGDFNEWTTSDEGYMNITPDGNRFWIELTSIPEGVDQRFQYLVGGTRVADPYAEKLLDPWNDQYIPASVYTGSMEYPEGMAGGIVSVFNTMPEEYIWDNTSFIPPPKEELVIYELLVRDFVASHDIKTLIDTLNYLDRLGVNAIELMPVNEFDGNNSWGYNPNFYFAVDKYYGSGNDLREFVDSCHNRGMAVILDMVLNHSWGQSPMVLMWYDKSSYSILPENPYYNVTATHDYNVGYDFNHDSEATRYFSKRVMQFWIEEYNIDGYRFDLSKGFTQKNTLGNVSAWGEYDANRVALWKMYADHIWSVDADSYIILEHFADNAEEKELAGYGMMLWGNISHQYSEAAMGYSSDISWASWINRGWDYPHLITYMESHDEERMQYNNTKFGSQQGDYNIKFLYTGLERDILAAALHFTIPGPKMLWQFGEVGYDYSIDYNGRTGEKPIRWDYYLNDHRRRVYDAWAALIRLKRTEPAFTSEDFTISQQDKKKSISIAHSDMDIMVMGSFELSITDQSVQFTRTGKWYEFFTGDSITVESVNSSFTMKPGEYRIYTTKKLTRPQIALSVNDVLYTRANGDWITLWPNPAGDNLSLTIDPELPPAEYALMIMDMNGRTVISTTIEQGQGERKVNISSLAPGSYMLRLSGNGITGIKRLIKR
ncbi:MAG: alpha-amylase family glycosyl hydrolase [Bacteroidales bacterium]